MVSSIETSNEVLGMAHAKYAKFCAECGEMYLLYAILRMSHVPLSHHAQRWGLEGCRD